jgi:hypothetical protein
MISLKLAGVSSAATGLMVLRERPDGVAKPPPRPGELDLHADRRS